MRTAQQAYCTELTDLQQQLGRLQTILDALKSADPTKIHWAHVGSVVHLNELLDEAIQFCPDPNWKG